LTVFQNERSGRKNTKKPISLSAILPNISKVASLIVALFLFSLTKTKIVSFLQDYFATF